MDKIQEMSMIMTKARNIIETGKGERLTNEEYERLKECGGIVFVVYEHAINSLDNKEVRGGIDYER